ncbi:hypothetical protein HDU86_001811 [Geranomyces michiganensis]|nr:hypothetical protein HDU86_001811 [Geranomyces michiganensis]
MWLFCGIYLVVRSKFSILLLITASKRFPKFRNVKSDFNESQHIIPCVYILLLVSLILTPINYTASILPFRVRTIFVCFLQAIAGTFLVCQMFIPKLIASVAWSKNKQSGGVNDTVSSNGQGSTMAHTAKSDMSKGGEPVAVEGTYLQIPIVEVSSGGVLSKYTAHTGFILKASNQLVLKKFRQQPATFYTFTPDGFTKLGDKELAFKAEDESLKLRFPDATARESFFATVSACGKQRPGKSHSTVALPSSNIRQTARASFVEA